MSQTDAVVALLNDGIAEKRKGDFQGALALYEKARQLDPLFANCYLNLGKIYYITDNHVLSAISYLKYAHVKLVKAGAGKSGLRSVVGDDLFRHFAHAYFDNEERAKAPNVRAGIEGYKSAISGRMGSSDESLESRREQQGVKKLLELLDWDKINQPVNLLRDIEVYQQIALPEDEK